VVSAVQISLETAAFTGVLARQQGVPKRLRAARLLEIEENLVRRELGQAMRAKLTSERAEVIVRIAKENTVQGLNGIKGAAAKTTTGVNSLAKLTGRSVGSVHADIKRGDAIDGKDLSQIAGTSIDTGVGLDALAGATADERKEVMAAGSTPTGRNDGSNGQTEAAPRARDWLMRYSATTSTARTAYATAFASATMGTTFDAGTDWPVMVQT
jgi:hypothetical protein